MGKTRQPELDFLRALAVCAVLLGHANHVLSGVLPGAIGRCVMDVAENTGWMGVDLFFVLSGFLVSGLLFHEHREHGSITPLRFYIRRGLKIYPAFYVMIAVSVGLGLHDANAPSGAVLLSECLFVQNYGRALWNHTWSLAVEEHFYLLLPFLLLLVLKCSKAESFRRLPVVIVMFMALVAGLRILTMYGGSGINFRVYEYSHCRMDSLMCGVFLSYLAHYHAEALRKFVERNGPLLFGVFVFGILLVKLPRSREWMHTGGFVLLYLAFGSLLLIFCCNPRHHSVPNMILRPLAWVGQFSYSIYLWHLFVGVWVAAHMRSYDYPGGYWVALACYISASLLVGVMMSKLIEYPVLAFRDRVFPSRGSTALAEAAPAK